jgi:hypothetical protein
LTRLFLQLSFSLDGRQKQKNNNDGNHTGNDASDGFSVLPASGFLTA